MGERDLRENGGVLDGVIFAMVKYTTADMNYLLALAQRNPNSYIIPWHMEGGSWDVIWRLADEPGAYYIKIDDDVTYIADGAIAEMIREKRRGRFLFVSANVVNHGILSAVHQEHAVALGRAVIAHWTFSVQEKGLLANTTLLERYRARAEILMQDNAERFYRGEWQPRGHTWER